MVYLYRDDWTNAVTIEGANIAVGDEISVILTGETSKRAFTYNGTITRLFGGAFAVCEFAMNEDDLPAAGDYRLVVKDAEGRELARMCATIGAYERDVTTPKEITREYEQFERK